MGDWWPAESEYTPGIDKRQWSELLHNPKIFGPKSLAVMKQMLNFGGEATFKQISEKYGRKPYFHIAISVSLAKKIYKETTCRLLPEDDSKITKWLPILFLGRYPGEEIPGTYSLAFAP